MFCIKRTYSLRNLTMSKLLKELPSSASNNESLILHGLDLSNQNEFAEYLKVDPSTT